MSTPLHRAKLTRPRIGEHMVTRPRLLAQLDRCVDVPLTLIAAPAGFGKTTLLAEWQACCRPAAAWLNVDDGDRVLSRFVVSVLAALETVRPFDGAPVARLLRRPHEIAAFETGAALADQLFDTPHDVVLIIDDYQQAACVKTEDFLRGLIANAPPSFHLMLATRHDPAMPLGRMRAQGLLNELREADLRFTAEEVRSFLAMRQLEEPDPALAEALHEWTGGWIAVLRLASRALPTLDASAPSAEAILSHRNLMDFLVEEVLAKQDGATQDVLLRIAIAEPLTASLAAVLVDREPPEGCQELLEMLARDGLLLEPVDAAANSFRVHPLLRQLLLHRLELQSTAEQIALLHVRASDWFAAQGEFEPAIRHRLAAGDHAGAAALVEQNVQPLLDREDWPALDALLGLLPEPFVQQNPTLLLATAWVSHLRGRLSAVRVTIDRVKTLLAALNSDQDVAETFAAECDSLDLGQLLPSDQDPQAAVARACAAAERIPADHRLPKGLAYIACGCALQSIGQTAKAIRWLTDVGERDEERIDAGSIRSLLGLVFVHRQAGDFPACRAVAAQLAALAERHDLPVAAGWGQWALGWIAYEHDALADAVAHFSAIAADHARCHLSCVGEALFGLAFAYEALGEPVEADRALRQATDIVLDANALGFLPSIRAIESWLAVRRGAQDIALDWLRADFGSVTDGNTLLGFAHEGMIRIKIQLAEGSPQSVRQARRALAGLRAAAEAGHHQAQLAAILALEALALEAEGEHEAAVIRLGRSIDLAAPAGLCRAYLDLGPAIAPPLRRLAARAVPTPYLERLLGSVMGAAADEAPPARAGQGAPSWLAGEVLTEREAEVLAGLCERRSYKEIGETLFISPNTVKRHACNIYAKLGVNNRQQALAKVERLGWSAGS